MMGRKTLAEVRAELEAAFGRTLAAPEPPADVATSPGRVAVWESLRRFLGKVSADDAGPPAPNPARPPSRPKSGRRQRAAGG